MLKINLLSAFCGSMLTATAWGGTATYTVTVDTTSLAGTTGSLDLTFDSGPGASYPVTAMVSNFSGGVSRGFVSGFPAGNAAGGPLPGTITFNNVKANNEDFEIFTFGQRISFDVQLSGVGIGPGSELATSGTSLVLGLYTDTAGRNPVAFADPSTGMVLSLNISAVGTISNSAVSPKVTFGQQQTITFGPIGNQTAGTQLTLTASASSGLPVSFASQTPGVCTVSGSMASLLAAGTCSITASQNGNSTYAPAGPVSQSFTVPLKAQTITFNATPSQTQGKPLTLAATASSGLVVVFSSSTPAVCTVSGVTANLVSSGTCIISASQPGNGAYAAATPVLRSFTVAAAFTITPLPPAETAFLGEVAGFILELRSATRFTGTITLSCSGGPAGSSCVDFPQTVRLFNGYGLAVSGILFPRSTPQGIYTVTFTGTSGAIVNRATATFTVRARNLEGGNDQD